MVDRPDVTDTYVSHARALLSTHPILRKEFTDKRVAKLARDPFVRSWHPLFGHDVEPLHVALARLEKAIESLRERKVVGTDRRVRHLREAASIPNYLAARDELLLGAELSNHMVVRFREGAGPDLIATAAKSVANVELTSVHATESLERLKAAIGAVLDEDDVDSTVWARIEYESATVTIPDSFREEAAKALRSAVRGCALSTDDMTAIATLQSPRVTVEAMRREGAGVLTTSSEAAFSAPPTWHFARIMESAFAKAAHQLPRDEPNVVVIDLVMDAAASALLFGIQSTWGLYVDTLPAEMPHNLDAVVFVWIDTLGRSWGQAWVIRNPSSAWVTTQDARLVLEVLSRPLNQAPSDEDK